MDAKFLFSRVRPNQCTRGNAVDAHHQLKHFVPLEEMGVLPLQLDTPQEHWFDDSLAGLLPQTTFHPTQLAVLMAGDSDKLQLACVHHVGGGGGDTTDVNHTVASEEEEEDVLVALVVHGPTRSLRCTVHACPAPRLHVRASVPLRCGAKLIRVRVRVRVREGSNLKTPKS